MSGATDFLGGQHVSFLKFCANLMPNLWKQFQDLLPASTRLIGTVVTDHADGTLSIELLGGGVLHVTGTAAVGARIFARDGRMTSEAPDLPSIEIEI